MDSKFTVNNHRTPFHSTFDVGRSMFDVQFFVAFPCLGVAEGEYGCLLRYYSLNLALYGSPKKP